MAKKNNNEEGVVLTPAQLKKIAEAASQVAIEEYRREEERCRVENRDKRLYNTRLLMEKYRGMVKYSEDAVYDAMQVDEDYELKSLVEMMFSGNDNYSLTVHSIQERVCQVKVILSHVGKMLEFYEYKCKSSGKQEIIRKWDTIYFLYLCEEERTVADLAEEFFVDISTVYKYNRAALQDLSALIFGWIG